MLADSRGEKDVWTAPRRYRLMKLRLADNLVINRGSQTIAGTVTRLEPDGFWIEAADGMSYRFALPADGGSDHGATSSDR